MQDLSSTRFQIHGGLNGKKDAKNHASEFRAFPLLKYEPLQNPDLA